MTTLRVDIYTGILAASHRFRGQVGMAYEDVQVRPGLFYISAGRTAEHDASLFTRGVREAYTEVNFFRFTCSSLVSVS